ncbi:MAG: hypothetical protein WBQ60_03165 [Asticcacaulis sp.]
MASHEIWNCPPQVKDLPRDVTISVTCRACRKSWGESVQNLIETHKLGVEFADLLEWKYRCTDPACGGMVTMVFSDEANVRKPDMRTGVAHSATASLRATERAAYPLKAVVKPRLYEAPFVPVSRRQMPLPLSGAMRG